MFLPITKKEMHTLGWDACDIILVTGDAYIDHPHMGVAVIGKVLMDAGYRVGVIPQPDSQSETDIDQLGEPKLFWGVTGGSVDSMVANYTPLKKKRKKDDYTPGGENSKRPDRAVIAYANLIRRYFKNTKPIVLGGIEASMRRIAHYDFWSNSVRRSILFDAKAEYLVYGMGEKTTVQLADALRDQSSIQEIRGLCYISKEPVEESLELSDYEVIKNDPVRFSKMFMTFYENQDARSAKRLIQKQDTRYLVHNPPQYPLSQKELDSVYSLNFERESHPHHQKEGFVRALDTIRFSIASHRGCYGECNFCAIAVHEGREVQWRSENSIIEEVKDLGGHQKFKGIIQDVGGPTANMYGYECDVKKTKGACKDKRCIYPDVCPQMKVTHQHQVRLLKKIRELPGIRKVFIGSGIRYDLILKDQKYGSGYMEELVRHHVSGQLKVAPEHTESVILQLMGKNPVDHLLTFKDWFDKLTRKIGKKQFLTYYFIAAYPGCTEKHMRNLRQFATQKLRLLPEQVQIFTPLPSTIGSVMYYTGKDPVSGQRLYVERSPAGKERQKKIIQK